ncbi:MAG TPA: hypothetical protein VFZ61_29885 [Polyangiales bacterium]
MTPRLWNVVLHLHADGLATVQIHVDARLLLPSCESRPARDALGYVEAVLVDSRPEDQLALRVQSCSSSPQYRRAKDVRDANTWLHERVEEALEARHGGGTTGPDAPGGSASSGIRPALGTHESALHLPMRPFKAGS